MRTPERVGALFQMLSSERQIGMWTLLSASCVMFAASFLGKLWGMTDDFPPDFAGLFALKDMIWLNSIEHVSSELILKCPRTSNLAEFPAGHSWHTTWRWRFSRSHCLRWGVALLYLCYPSISIHCRQPCQHLAAEISWNQLPWSSRPFPAGLQLVHHLCGQGWEARCRRWRWRGNTGTALQWMKWNISDGMMLIRSGWWCQRRCFEHLRALGFSWGILES